jgi:hypothetical protein
VGAYEGGLSMHAIIDAFQFIGDNLHFILTKTLDHLALLSLIHITEPTRRS